MGVRQIRKTKSTYDLNLAPILDIIVSIVPMLLLSVAFIQVRMIETPIPAVVSDKVEEQKKKDDGPTLELKVSKNNGFVFVVTDKGKPREIKIANAADGLNFKALRAEAIDLKRQYQDIFSVSMTPDKDVSFDSLVKVIDTLRRLAPEENQKKFAFNDAKTGKVVETDYMFTDVTFSNIVGE